MPARWYKHLHVNQRHDQVADISVGIVQVMICVQQENKKWHADICPAQGCPGMHMDAHVYNLHSQRQQRLKQRVSSQLVAGHEAAQPLHCGLQTSTIT